MEQFVREYATKSILPHLNSRKTLLTNFKLNQKSQDHNNIHDDSNIVNNNYYFIATPQLLNGTGGYMEDDSKYNDSISTEMLMLEPLSSVSSAIENLIAPTNFSIYTQTSTNSGIYNSSQYNDYYEFLNFSCDGESLSVSALNATDSATEDESALSSVYFKTLVYLLYIPIFVFALLGNGTVCYIVQSTPRMRTVTNYFISNLAVGDILMSLFCVPFSFVSIFILGYWPFGIALCYLVNYSQAVSVLVSAYTLVAISIDRFIAIMWPLRPRITKRYAKFIIAGVWAIALVTAFPIPIVSSLTQPDIWHVQCHRYICSENWPSNQQSYYYTLALFTLQFVVPLAVLIFTYTRIALAVWGKRPPGEAENSRDQRMARSKRKMIKMMVTVVIVFTICWLPFNILVLLLNDEEFKQWEPLPYFWFAFHWLAMSHSCYNPIIYCYMNARFRGGFLQIIYRVPGLRRCCCLRHYLRSRGERNYEATGEMTFKFNRDNGGGLIRKPKLRIRNRRCLPPATDEHVHHLHQHQKKTPSEFYASESIFMCGNHSVAVVPAT